MEVCHYEDAEVNTFASHSFATDDPINRDAEDLIPVIDLIYQKGWRIETGSFAALLNRFVWSSRFDGNLNVNHPYGRKTAMQDILTVSTAVEKLNAVITTFLPSNDAIISSETLKFYKDPLETYKRQEEADKLFAQGEQAYSAGEIAESVRVFLQARALDSTYRAGEIAYRLGFSYRDLKDSTNNMQSAIQEAKMATTLLNDAQSESALGDLYRIYGAYDLSQEAFDRCVKKAETPESEADCHVWSGQLAVTIGNYQIARSEWNKALKLDPTNVDASKRLQSFAGY